MQDGELVASGLPMAGSVEVVEDVADIIVEELLEEHAQGRCRIGDRV